MTNYYFKELLISFIGNFNAEYENYLANSFDNPKLTFDECFKSI